MQSPIFNQYSESDWRDWIWQQNHALKNVTQLRELAPWLESGLEKTSQNFQFQITPYYLSLLNLNEMNDPLAKITFPTLAELDWKSDEFSDPIGDRVHGEQRQHQPTPAIVHRYPDRCLLFLTPLCSSYCRYCFRRELVAKPENTFSKNVLEKSVQYIADTTSLREVILSGGDPLLMSDEKLGGFLSRLAEIPHLRTLRIHTRFPVFNPFRITPSLLQVFSEIKLPLTMMVHVMHPREVTDEFKIAMRRLQKAGVLLLNQSVLIKDCNDKAEILKELSYKLVECGIVPQYLHILDRARGTSHFRVSVERAQQILREIRGQLPGYMIPQLTLDIPGGHGKIPLEAPYFQEHQGAYNITSPLSQSARLTYQDSGVGARPKEAPNLDLRDESLAR